MSEFTRDKSTEPRPGISRRWFIQGAAAAIGAAGLAFGQDRSRRTIGDKPFINDGSGAADCGCVNEAQLPIFGAAAVGGRYYGVLGTESGPRIISLSVDAGNGVVGGQPIRASLPPEFELHSIGVARGSLIATGGLPFVIETLEVDYELSEDVRIAMDNNIPPDIPTTGRQKVEILGLRPAAFIVRDESVEELALPSDTSRSFAVATAVVESNGGPALLVEHSDGMNESRYASAIDVLEENGGSWKTWSAARTLGESGPNFLASDGSQLVIGINTERGSFAVTADSAMATSFARPEKLVALVSANTGIAAIVKDNTGQHVWSSLSSRGQLTAGRSAELSGDELIGAAAVSGSPGQVILLGRRSTVLIEDASAFVTQLRGGSVNVM